MKYSEAFESLHNMSFDINLMVEAKYKRVAIYIGRVMMAESAIRFGIDNNTRPPHGIIDWAQKVKGSKESVLYHVVRLTDYEWKKIMPVMVRLADQSGGSETWKVTRKGYAQDLDTLREFERA